jgi:hypothetical protein
MASAASAAATAGAGDGSRGALAPEERVAEVLFGLIMVLTFTGSLSVAEAERNDVRTMLIGALGCNIAWGVIDGILYLMGCLSERGRGVRALRAVQVASNPDEAYRAIADALPPLVAASLTPAEYEPLREKLTRLPTPPPRPTLSGREWLGALSVFAWVFVTTLPVAIPFVFIHDVARAMRTSNAVAVTMLFFTGFVFGRITGYRPWLMGVVMVVLGCALVALTMALGG